MDAAGWSGCCWSALCDFLPGESRHARFRRGSLRDAKPAASGAEDGSFWWRGGGSQPLATVIHNEGAVHTLMDIDPSLGVARAVGARQQLHPMLAELDGIVGSHGALVLKAEQFLGESVEVQRLVGHSGVVGGTAKCC